MTLATAALLCGACQQKEAKPPAKAPAKPAKPAEAASKPSTDSRSLHKHMQEHFVKADNLKDAVVAGKLDDAKALAKWMVEHPAPKDLPAMYKPHVERLRGTAQVIVDGAGASEVAHGAAAMAAACAKCHQSRGKQLDFGSDPEPAAGDDISKSHMARHAWAATRMWDGVVGGSDELYSTGAKIMSELPLFAVSLKKDNKLMAAAADQMIDQLKVSAEKAVAAKSPEARAEVLGAVLSTCSNCHAMLDKGPE